MNHIRLLVRSIIKEAVAAVEKTYSIKLNTVSGNYILYKTFIDDSDYYEPVKKTVKVMDLGKDPEGAKKKAFSLTKRELELPNSNIVKQHSLADSTISIGKYKNEKLSNIPISYLFELLFFHPKFKFTTSLRDNDEYQKVYTYLTTEKASELKDFFATYVKKSPKSLLINIYDQMQPYNVNELVFGEILKPLLQNRLSKEFGVEFDDIGKVIELSGAQYEKDKNYTKTVGFFSSMASKNNPGDYVWFFIDEDGNLIKFIRDKDFESSTPKYKITFTVKSIAPIKGKSTFLVTSTLWSVQSA